MGSDRGHRDASASSHTENEVQLFAPPPFLRTTSAPQTDELDTAGCVPVRDGKVSGQRTWQNLRSRGCNCGRCSESSCGAGVRPASTGVDGSQEPPCDPN